MRVMHTSWPRWEPGKEASVTIGVFDGVHRGHRALIDRLSSDYEKTVLTFDPHPIEILRPGTPPRLITTIDERLALLDGAGVAQAGVLDLSEIKDLAPERFVEEVLVHRLNIRQLVLGPDFRFGKDRAGDVDLLERMAGAHGYEVDVIELVSDGGEEVSSSRIRSLIESGRPGEAARYLTTRFSVTGPVIHGDKRGAAIGYPTANLRPPERKVVPATGVYAAFAHLEDRAHPAAVSVGVRPTFGGGELLIEAYIMDFDDAIYGQHLGVEFVEYLRPELDFDEVDSLIAQMDADVARARSLLESTASNVG
jgi:riboflavin kinase/FMN adenylyltransferase